MAQYCLCCTSRGRVFRCEDFAAFDDEDAIRVAAELRGVTEAQLWAGERLVASFAQGSATLAENVLQRVSRAA